MRPHVQKPAAEAAAASTEHNYRCQQGELCLAGDIKSVNWRWAVYGMLGCKRQEGNVELHENKQKTFGSPCDLIYICV